MPGKVHTFLREKPCSSRPVDFDGKNRQRPQEVGLLFPEKVQVLRMVCSLAPNWEERCKVSLPVSETQPREDKSARQGIEGAYRGPNTPRVQYTARTQNIERGVGWLREKITKRVRRTVMDTRAKSARDGWKPQEARTARRDENIKWARRRSSDDGFEWRAREGGGREGAEELSEKLTGQSMAGAVQGGTHVGSYEPGSHGTIDLMGCTV